MEEVNRRFWVPRAVLLLCIKGKLQHIQLRLEQVLESMLLYGTATARKH